MGAVRKRLDKEYTETHTCFASHSRVRSSCIIGLNEEVDPSSAGEHFNSEALSRDQHAHV